MLAPVTLPRISWGDPHCERRALLVHGLGSSGALMWRYGVALADAGWCADAVDLRGHGSAPRTLDYTIDAYAADLARPRAPGSRPWDLVIGHSLGGAASVVAAAADPEWTRRLVLIDPAIRLADRDREIVRASQEEAFADPTPAAVRAAHPQWHEHDIELKALSAQQASPWAVAQTSEQNPRWDVTATAVRLTIPTHVLASDPAVYSIFTGDVVDRMRENPQVTVTIVPGTGHSPHRDRPEATLAALADAIASGD